EDIAAAFSAAHAADWRVLPAAEVLRRAQVERADALVSGEHLRLWPHVHGSDGFFAAAWERV
ncbi:MAG TPA: SAM-dependent methyltransferase, partial [Burkholderiaceae bacterium]|nr:SAM-dependent methyltransferase [Burkholderiaceae bacterium]